MMKLFFVLAIALLAAPAHAAGHSKRTLLTRRSGESMALRGTASLGDACNGKCPACYVAAHTQYGELQDATGVLGSACICNKVCMSQACAKIPRADRKPGVRTCPAKLSK